MITKGRVFPTFNFFTLIEINIIPFHLIIVLYSQIMADNFIVLIDVLK